MGSSAANARTSPSSRCCSSRSGPAPRALPTRRSAASVELEEIARQTALDSFRLEPDIADASPRLDDVRPANIAALERAADALIRGHGAQLDAIAALV